MELDLWLDGRLVARTRSRDRGRKVRIEYEPEVAAALGDEVPLLSCSLPTPGPSTPAAARAFLEGLLPEGRALEAAAAGVRGVQLRAGYLDAPADVVALLSEYGRECAGAVVAVPPGEPGDQRGSYRRLEADELAAAIADLPARPLGTDLARGIRMSLAGAQPKLLLARVNGQWCEAVGGAPSTHILKPSGVWAHSAENEALVMTLARAVGLTDRAAWAEQIGGRSVLVAERYDRHQQGKRIRRSHQEDMCQALGLRPAQKYEIGRPRDRMARVLRVFTRAPQVELERFFRQVAFRVLVGDEDSHGKNFSLLLTAGEVTLTPLYDSLCTLLYPELSGVMAAPIDDQQSLLRVDRAALLAEARGIGLPAAVADAALAELAAGLVAGLAALPEDLTAGWPAERVIDLIRERLARFEAGKPLGGPRPRRAPRRVTVDDATTARQSGPG